MVLPLVTLLDDQRSCRGLVKVHWQTVKGTVLSKQHLRNLQGARCILQHTDAEGNTAHTCWHVVLACVDSAPVVQAITPGVWFCCCLKASHYSC